MFPNWEVALKWQLFMGESKCKLLKERTVFCGSTRLCPQHTDVLTYGQANYSSLSAPGKEPVTAHPFLQEINYRSIPACCFGLWVGGCGKPLLIAGSSGKVTATFSQGAKGTIWAAACRGRRTGPQHETCNTHRSWSRLTMLYLEVLGNWLTWSTTTVCWRQAQQGCVPQHGSI